MKGSLASLVSSSWVAEWGRRGSGDPAMADVVTTPPLSEAPETTGNASPN